MTTEEAKALYETEFWTSLNDEEIALFQLFEPKLCMPFDVFHRALEAALGRPVWTHEFGFNYEGLKKELLGEKQAPTMDEIMNLIPPEKRVVLITTDDFLTNE